MLYEVITRGEWVMILHADTVLQPGWTAAVAAHVSRAEARPA